jgi:beta-glucosidase
MLLIKDTPRDVKVNPGGKLPVSLARSAGELPIFYNRHPSADVNAYIEGKRKPLFAFGHDLS